MRRELGGEGRLAELRAQLDRPAAQDANDAVSSEVYDLFQAYVAASDRERAAINRRLEALKRRESGAGKP